MKVAGQRGPRRCAAHPASLAFLLLVLGSVANCHAGRGSEQYAAEMMERTVPPDVPAPFMSQARDPDAFRAHWEFRVRTEAEAYRKWLSERMAGFAHRAASQNDLVFAKTMAGDVWTVRVRLSLEDPTLHVQVDFAALPF